MRRFLTTRLAAAGLDARIHVVHTPPTASLPRRVARLADAIAVTAGGDSDPLHLIGHSSGGLDARLLVAPEVALPMSVVVERLAARVRSVVTIATPHHRTPLASFFTTLRGQQLLQVVSLLTSVRPRPGIRYGSVVAEAAVPGLCSTIAAGLDPAAQVTRARYTALHRLAAATPRRLSPRLAPEVGRTRRHAYGTTPSAAANDWLVTGSGFDRGLFEALWNDVRRFLAAGADAIEISASTSRMSHHAAGTIARATEHAKGKARGRRR